MKRYCTTDRLWIRSLNQLREELADRAEHHYVYLLCRPPFSPHVYPFYVGISQSDRLFAHEEEARSTNSKSHKIEEIHRIWDAGDAVVRIIDSFHSKPPWHREQELIEKFGLLKDGTGQLTNEQKYSPSHREGKVELRKYAKYGNELPPNFIHQHKKLKVGENEPKSKNSVHGKYILYCWITQGLPAQNWSSSCSV